VNERERLVRLKCDLLVDGLHVGDSVADAMGANGLKMPERVRSGSSEGLELTIDGLAVLAAVRTSMAEPPAYRLLCEEDALILARGDERWPVEITRRPAYYDFDTSRGIKMALLAHTCFDRVGVVALRECHLWSDPDSRCRFCSYGTNLSQESARRTSEDLMEAVRAARDDVEQPSRHVLISGGSDLDVDGVVVPEIVSVASSLAPLGMPLDAMLSPPTSRAPLERLREAGVSSVSINLEVSDPATAKRIVPGKWRLGRDRYLRALRDAVGVFGAGRVRSLLVVGLESQEHTLDGVRDIAETGAFPTLSPFRPLPGSDLADDLAPSAEFLEQVYWEARETVRGLGLALGPLCRSCQCNTLAFPWDASDAEGIGTAEGWVL
jgi:hypothetical protein